MNVLVTGGAGYIGSHTALELLTSGHDVEVVDNLINSSAKSLKRVAQLTGKKIRLNKFDLRDRRKLDSLFKSKRFDAVIHFAGLKAVGESTEKPLEYYSNNLDSTLCLCEAMKENGVKKLVFSSSATVYGTSSKLPLKETSHIGIGITNPYGWSKYMIEQILRDIGSAEPGWQITLLRYFNPIGAHKSGRIGEDPNGVPNNLLPYISQVAVRKLSKLHVYGSDYDTPDGTGVRDYIHVVDLARGHMAALKRPGAGVRVYNLGTGRGTSVLQLIKAFEKASGKQIPYVIDARRPGDVASCYADCSKANQELGWKARMTIEEACHDAWNWQLQNPDGYKILR